MLLHGPSQVGLAEALILGQSLGHGPTSLDAKPPRKCAMHLSLHGHLHHGDRLGLNSRKAVQLCRIEQSMLQRVELQR